MSLKNKIHKLKILKSKLKHNKVSIGTFMQLNSPEVAEILSSSNYEWIALDMEHGSIQFEDLNNLLRSIELYSKVALVRIANGDAVTCKKVLDSGAQGVIVPLVESSDQLKKIISYCKYPPLGIRGVAFTRSNIFGKKFNENFNVLSKLSIVFAMIESEKALNNLDDILKTKYLDGIFIGPYDLSASLGCPGQFKNKKFINSLKKIKNKSIENKIPFGIHVVENDKKDLFKKIKEGYSFIAYSMDTNILTTFAKVPKF